MMNFADAHMLAGATQAMDWTVPHHHPVPQYHSHQQCHCAMCTGANPYFTLPESPLQQYSPLVPPAQTVDYFAFQESQSSLPQAPSPLLPPPSPLYPAPNPLGYDNASDSTVMSPLTPMTTCTCEACMSHLGHQSPVDMYAHLNAQHQQFSSPQFSSPLMPVVPLPHHRNSFAAHNEAQEKRQHHHNANRDIAVTDESFQRIVGQMCDIARTSGGSSFLQACLKDRECDRFHVIHSELKTHFAELLLDSHGCYVMRSLMEQMTPEHLLDVLHMLAADEQLTFSLCTHSLHTRRIVQFLLEGARVEGCQFIVDLMVKKCREIATTQQGCIAMQRVMDCASAEQKVTLYAKVYEHLMEFAHDPFANYVVQYILENGEKATTSEQVWSHFKGNVTPLACNKFASNVVEKALHHTSPEVQHLIVSELYSNSTDFLQQMLQDSFGNYIVQATIALCSFKDVWMISEKLKPILHTTPYGYKIAARLERRLKGKPLTNARTVNYNQNQHLRS